MHFSKLSFFGKKILNDLSNKFSELLSLNMLSSPKPFFSFSLIQSSLRKTTQKEPRNFYEVPSENYILGVEYFMLFGLVTSHQDKQ